MAKGEWVDKQDRAIAPGVLGRGRAPALDAAQMRAAALKRSRCDAFGDYSFVLPLQRLIASCNAESDLNGLGCNAVR
ncbi:MAG: hypothetical protein ACRETJ_04875, partial [Steroidobacteraceae bacterium]